MHTRGVSQPHSRKRRYTAHLASRNSSNSTTDNLPPPNLPTGPLSDPVTCPNAYKRDPKVIVTSHMTVRSRGNQTVLIMLHFHECLAFGTCAGEPNPAISLWREYWDFVASLSCGILWGWCGECTKWINGAAGACLLQTRQSYDVHKGRHERYTPVGPHSG